MPKNRSKSKDVDLTEKTGKQKRLFRNLVRTIQQFIQGRSFVPLTEEELMNRLHLPEQHTDLLKEALESLVTSKQIETSGGRYYSKRTTGDYIVGVMHLHPRGFGFVKADGSAQNDPDIFIPKHLTMNAVDGDKVEVLINNESISEKGPEGRVVAITTRARTHLGGTIRQIGKNGSYLAYAPMLGMAQRVVVETDRDLKVGDRIVMEIIEWGNKDTPTYCRLSHRIGNIDDPTCDIPAAIEEFELRRDFPIQAVEEARAYGDKVPVTEIKKREDLRKLTCFTIDPDTAKDFDDAISLTKDSAGHYHLGVHIADVSHYVRPGTALDTEAQLRCNSTYFPGFALPMLPPELSDNLCSLKADVNRLTVSVIMRLDVDGTLLEYRLARTVIKSEKRFTYKEAKAVLDGKQKSPHLDALKLMVELCGHLKKKRYERGSIEFGMPELVVIVDEKGMPTHTDYIVYDITHRLVEEFMLKANEVVAQHLTKEGKNLAYRVHDEPAEENMKDFSNLANIFGFQLSPTPTPGEIQKLFDEAMTTSSGQYLATSYIRRMRLAIYSSDNIGHFGLSLGYYCHFTSPIRRYVDLVIHRALFQENEPKEKLEMIAQRCSEQERISSKAEKSVVLLKKLRLLDSIKKKEPFKEYSAVVTKVKNFGVYFEIPDLMLESYLHVSQLENDYYLYDEASVVLRGTRTGKVYCAGDTLTLMLKEVDFITLDSVWTIVAEERPADLPPPGKKVKKGKLQGKAKAAPKKAVPKELESFRKPREKKEKKPPQEKKARPSQLVPAGVKDLAAPARPPKSASKSSSGASPLSRGPFQPRKLASMIGNKGSRKKK